MISQMLSVSYQMRMAKRCAYKDCHSLYVANCGILFIVLEKIADGGAAEVRKKCYRNYLKETSRVSHSYFENNIKRFGYSLLYLLIKQIVFSVKEWELL